MPPSRDDEHHLEDEDLRRLARKLSQDSLAADDLMQDAWLAQRASKAKDVTSKKRWLARILINLARKRRHRELRRHEHERAASKPERVEHVDGAADHAEIARLRKSIRALRQPYREVIELHYFEALSFAQIAARLGRSEATLRSQHARALEILRRHGARGWHALVPFGSLLERLRERFGRKPRTARRVAATGAGATWLWRALAPAGVVVIAVAFLFAPEPEPEREDLVEVAERGVAERDRALVYAPNSTEPRTRELGAADTESFSRDGGVAESASASEAVDPSRVLRVAVRDASGAPIPLAEVHVRAAADQAAQTWSTDEHGAVEIPIDDVATTCEAGRECVLLSATADEWGSRFEHRVPIDTDRSSTIELPLADLEMRVTGRITDMRGAPVAGVTVVANPAHGDSFELAAGAVVLSLRHAAVTAADGGFELAHVPRERRRIEVFRDGAVVHEWTVEPARSDAALEVQLEDTATLSGTIRRADGAPAADVSVFTERYGRRPGRAFTTDADGRFRVEGLRAGWARVWATLTEPEFEAATDVLYFEPGSERVWNAVLATRAPLSVRVLNRDRTPSVCAKIDFARWAKVEEIGDRTEKECLLAFDQWTRQTVTDETGRAVIHPAPEGPVDVKVFLAALSETLPAIIEFDVRASAGEHEIVLAPPPARGSLAGRVLDANGRAFSNALLRIADRRTRAWTYAPLDPVSGGFRVERLPPSDYALDLSVDGRDAVFLLNVDVAGGEWLDVGVLRTQARAKLTVRWKWPIDPTGGRRYVLAQQVQREAKNVAMTLDSGRHPPAEGWELFPGVYSLHVLEAGQQRQFQVFGVPPESALEIESGPEGRFSIPVHITSAAGETESEVNVAVYRADEAEPCVDEMWRVPKSGTFTGCVYLLDGQYRIEVGTLDGRSGGRDVRVSEDLRVPLVEIALR